VAAPQTRRIGEAAALSAQRARSGRAPGRAGVGVCGGGSCCSSSG
jgi:hypothetical protein